VDVDFVFPCRGKLLGRSEQVALSPELGLVSIGYALERDVPAAALERAAFLNDQLATVR
jgi:hypothetical protein